MKKKKVKERNMVAKFAVVFCHARTFEDKTKFKRNNKHRLKSMSDSLVFA
jgi:hypothetical protein